MFSGLAMQTVLWMVSGGQVDTVNAKVERWVYTPAVSAAENSPAWATVGNVSSIERVQFTNRQVDDEAFRVVLMLSVTATQVDDRHHDIVCGGTIAEFRSQGAIMCKVGGGRGFVGAAGVADGIVKLARVLVFEPVVSVAEDSRMVSGMVPKPKVAHACSDSSVGQSCPRFCCRQRCVCE